MSKTMSVKVAERGVITLPKDIRDEYRISPGDDLTLIDLDGCFVLSPVRSEIDALADRIVSELEGKGESLESMLKVVREERGRYGGKK